MVKDAIFTGDNCANNINKFIKDTFINLERRQSKKKDQDKTPTEKST